MSGPLETVKPKKINYIFPVLTDFSSAKEYFGEFYKINHPQISHRTVASILDWPVSYFGDLIHGRKRLSVSRAVEFSATFQLTCVETEYLVMLALNDSENVAVQDYAKTFLGTTGASIELQNLEGPVNAQGDLVIDPKHASDLTMIAIHILLSWNKNPLSLQQIQKFLHFVPEAENSELILKKINTLKDLGIISGDLPNLKVLKDNLVVGNDKQHLRQQAAFLAMADWTRNPKIKNLLMDGMVVFPKNKWKDFQQKIQTLANWILNTSSQNVVDENSRLEEYMVLSLGIYVHRLFEVDAPTPGTLP